jgi:hypothetical protein
LATIEAGVRREETQAFRDVNLASISSTQDMFAMQIQGAMHERSVYADIMNTAALASRDVELTRILSDRDVSLSGISAQVTLGLDQGITDRHIATQQKKASRSSSMWGAIGAIGSLFSDVRVKNYIRQTGETPDGLPWYEWNISGFTQAGVMAQEAMEFYPENVSPHYTGLLAVDYGFLGNSGADAAGP